MACGPVHVHANLELSCKRRILPYGASGSQKEDRDHCIYPNRRPIIVREQISSREGTIVMAKVGRNDLCPCGSGKKFKKCCIALGALGNPIAKRGDSTDDLSGIADLVLDPAEEAKRRAVVILKEALSKLAPESQDWISASSWLVKAYQNLGEHRLALETISSLPQDPVTMISKGISLSALGEHAEACEVVGTAVNSMAFRKLKRRVRTYLYLDVGKVSGLAGDAVQAAKFYELARTGLGSSPDDRNHYARATANLGFILLHSPDPKEQSKGLAFIDQSSDIKAETGDLEPVINFIPLKSNKYPSAAWSLTMEGWETRVRLAIRAM